MKRGKLEFEIEEYTPEYPTVHDLIPERSHQIASYVIEAIEHQALLDELPGGIHEVVERPRELRLEVEEEGWEWRDLFKVANNFAL